ncbi:hypothetical protein F4604DRAFT_1687386 [Suillus subluteus]|nr:hypothetical protein F4604DRAFT_1687386 [Suillus subluteus]
MAITPHSITGHFIKLWMRCGCGHFPGPYKKLPPTSFLSLTFTTVTLPCPLSGYIPSHIDYMLPPSFKSPSSMTSVKPRGGLFPSLLCCDFRVSVPSAQVGPYPSRMLSSPSTSFIGRLCTPIEEEEDEDEELTPVEPQGGLLLCCDINACVPSAPVGPYQPRTPSSPSTSFIRSLCTLTEEEDEEVDELTSVEPQSGLFPGCDTSASVSSAQAGPYPSRTPSSPSTSFIRRLCTLIEEGEEE